MSLCDPSDRLIALTRRLMGLRASGSAIRFTVPSRTLDTLPLPLPVGGGVAIAA
jgi:hypothetical protein